MISSKRLTCALNFVHSLRIAACSSSFSPPPKVVHQCFSTLQTAVSVEDATKSAAYSDNEGADVDWDNLGFGLVPTDYMYTMKCFRDFNFTKGHLSRYGNIELSPSAGIINYGQGLFEGLKAYRTEDGRVILFRPDQNAMRMKMGAERMCMPCPSVDQFVDAVKQTTLANKRWIPPPGKGALYVRPLLLGTGAILGLAPSPEYSFLIYASPVGNYFKEGTAPLNLYVEEQYDRASRGGTGGIKSITNYGPALKPLVRAKNKGFSDVLYLDTANRKYIEEVSSCNVFMVKDGVISTPVINGTILPGVTRKSMVEIARDYGYEVKERLIAIEELLEADEVFCTGTAVVVASVGSITYKGKRIEYRRMGEESVYMKLMSTMRGIQSGAVEDKKGWILEL